MKTSKIAKVTAAVLLCGIMSAAPLADAVPAMPDMAVSVSAAKAEELAAPKNVKAAAGDGSVTLSWNKVKGAEAYMVFQYDAKTKKYKAVKTVTGTAYTVKSLKNGTECKFKVAAAVKSGKTYKAGKNSAAVSVTPAKSGSAKTNSDKTVKYVPASNTKPADYPAKAAEFKTKIDAFNKEVKELSLTKEEKKDYNEMIKKGYSVRKLSVDGVPLFEVMKKDGKEKPLDIILHGAGGHKDLNSAFWAAENGFCGVSIDCAGSGESKDGPLQAPAAWAETVKDIDSLIEYYNTVDGVNAANFGIEGGSMGGTISLCYVAHGKYKPTAIAPQLASPYFVGSEDPVGACFDKGGWAGPVWSDAEIKAFVKDYNPLNYPERFKDVWVYAGNGADDEIGPPANMEKLKNAVNKLGGKKFELTSYKGCGHWLPEDYYRDVMPKYREKILNK